MFPVSIHTLQELVVLLQKDAVKNVYSTPVAILSNGTIGQHLRHIVELYSCLLEGYQNATVNYEKRKRELLLETDTAAAVQRIEHIIKNFERPDKTLLLETTLDEKMVSIQTSYYRELFYNLEHCIHHQALIRAALISMGQHIVSENFGVAPSTQQYRKQCAQ